MTVRSVILAVHLWAGLILGLLLAVICLSGSAVVLINDCERWIYADSSRITPGRASYDAVVADLAAAHPGWEPAWYVTAATTGSVDTVWMEEEVAEGHGRMFRVFVDPGSGALLGSTRDGTAAAVLGWLADLHMTLLAGLVGMLVVASAGLVLVGFVLTGLWLWWPGLRRVGSALRVRWSAGGFLRHYDLHRTIGLVAAPAFVVIAVTGTMFYFQWTRELVFAGLGGQRGELRSWMRPEADQPTVEPRQGPTLPLDALAARAEAAGPGLRVSAIATHTHEPHEPWYVQCTFPGDLDPVAGSVIAHIDPWNGALVELEDGRSGSPGRWVTHHYWALHAGWWGVPGTWWGWVLRACYIVIGLAPTVLLITGIGIWLHRRRQARAVRGRRNSPSSTSISQESEP